MPLLPEYDQSLQAAITALVNDGGPLDSSAVEAEVANAVIAFGVAAIDGNVPEGVKFDANRERRLVAFRMVYQRFIDEIMAAFPEGMTVTANGISYRRMAVPDRVSGLKVAALVRIPSCIVGAGADLTQPAGRFKWGIPDDQFRVVRDRAALRTALEAANGVVAESATKQAQRERGRGVN